MTKFKAGDKVIQVRPSIFPEHDFPPHEYPVLTVNTTDPLTFYEQDPILHDGGHSACRFKLIEASPNVPPKKATGLGAKYDGGKLLFRALTRGLALPLRAVAAVLTYGALKYKEDSWQHVPDGKARYESALDRHLNAWKAGEKCDDESGLPHLAHAACNALFLLWFEITDGSIEGDYTKFNTRPSN